MAGKVDASNMRRLRDALPRWAFHNRAHIAIETGAMPRLAVEIALAAALTLGAIVSLASNANASDVMVSGAFARASAVSTAKAATVYLTVMNHGREPDRLIGIRTDAARSAGLHESAGENAVSSMRDVEALDLPPGATKELQPGGLHIMLTGLAAPLKAGATLKLTLIFEKAGEVAVDVPVAGVAATGEDHSAHMAP
jgi:hypothetical protein